MKKSVKQVVVGTSIFLFLLFFISQLPSQSLRSDQFTLMTAVGVIAIAISIILHARGDYLSSVVFITNVLTVLVTAIVLSSLELLNYYPYHSDIFVAGIPVFLILLLSFTIRDKYESPKWWWIYSIAVVGVATLVFLH